MCLRPTAGPRTWIYSLATVIGSVRCLEAGIPLVRGRGSDALWTDRFEVRADRPGTIPIEIPLGGEEGVYELILRATITRSGRIAPCRKRSTGAVTVA